MCFDVGREGGRGEKRGQGQEEGNREEGAERRGQRGGGQRGGGQRGGEQRGGGQRGGGQRGGGQRGGGQRGGGQRGGGQRGGGQRGGGKGIKVMSIEFNVKLWNFYLKAYGTITHMPLFHNCIMSCCLSCVFVQSDPARVKLYDTLH